MNFYLHRHKDTYSIYPKVIAYLLRHYQLWIWRRSKRTSLPKCLMYLTSITSIRNTYQTHHLKGTYFSSTFREYRKLFSTNLSNIWQTGIFGRSLDRLILIYLRVHIAPQRESKQMERAKEIFSRKKAEASQRHKVSRFSPYARTCIVVIDVLSVAPICHSSAYTSGEAISAQVSR